MQDVQVDIQVGTRGDIQGGLLGHILGVISFYFNLPYLARSFLFCQKLFQAEK